MLLGCEHETAIGVDVYMERFDGNSVRPSYACTSTWLCVHHLELYIFTWSPQGCRVDLEVQWTDRQQLS